MRKCENVNSDSFNNAVYGKLKGDPDGKLKYIKSLYKETGEVKFDLEYFEKMTNMDIRSGLDKAKLEEISLVARYITDELGNLRKALTEAIASESKRIIDPGDTDAEQDKNLRLTGLNTYKANLDNESNNVYTKLATVRDAFKEAQGMVEV